MATEKLDQYNSGSTFINYEGDFDFTIKSGEYKDEYDTVNLIMENEDGEIAIARFNIVRPWTDKDDKNRIIGKEQYAQLIRAAIPEVDEVDFETFHTKLIGKRVHAKIQAREVLNAVSGETKTYYDVKNFRKVTGTSTKINPTKGVPTPNGDAMKPVDGVTLPF